MTVFSGSTHPGKIRNHNEDVIGWDTDHKVWLVADGMGGHAHGEVASRLVKETLLQGVGQGSDLLTAVSEAHAVISATATQNSDYEGMGSTVVALEVNPLGARLVWVGDSRGYLWREGRLKLLTRDHSYLERLLAAEHITEEEARNHPRRNIVTQILGVGEAFPDETQVPLQRGDWLILCSDGLNDELTDAEIAEQLDASNDPEVAVENLIEAALSKGGRDNISVVVVQYDGEDSEQPETAGTQALELTTEIDEVNRQSLVSEYLPFLLGGAAAILVALLFWVLK